MATYGTLTAGSTTSNTWYEWTSTAGSANTTTAENAWNTWTDGITTGRITNVTYFGDNNTIGNIDPVEQIVPPAPVLTEEQRERLRQVAEAERVRIEAERAKRMKEKVLADKRANRLLVSLLNRRQRREWRDRKQISIYRNGRHLPSFILTNKESYNVVEVGPKGVAHTAHCVQARGVPMADQLATQLLYLKTHPEELLRVANHKSL